MLVIQLFCWCTRVCLRLCLGECIERPSRAWTSIWQDSTVSVQPKQPQLPFGKVRGIRKHLHWGVGGGGVCQCLIRCYIIYLQLPSRVEEEVTLSLVMSATSHVMRPFKITYSRNKKNKSGKEIEIKMEGDREGTYLLTEDQLVIKEEEDSLLAASVWLVDPWQLPGVDELRAPV